MIELNSADHRDILKCSAVSGKGWIRLSGTRIVTEICNTRIHLLILEYIAEIVPLSVIILTLIK